MKKRILSMLLVATMVMGIFTGCGTKGADVGDSNTSMEKITVSEMLANVVKENDGEIIIFTHEADSYKNNYSEKTKWFAYNYNGTSTQLLYGANDKVNTLTADLSLVDTSNPRTESKQYFRENAKLQIRVTREDSPVAFLEGNKIFFGECEHVEINGDSYMFFKAYKVNDTDKDVRNSYFTLIKDTEFTKDKTIVIDVDKDDSDGEISKESTKSSYFISNLTKEDKETFGIE